ncbi:hypothetical protein Avbf_13560 [Armadillidium vulgare]|nr:hypothetical protein Avbf_13560 [Armadillidium vulgare]
MEEVSKKQFPENQFQYFQHYLYIFFSEHRCRCRILLYHQLLPFFYSYISIKIQINFNPFVTSNSYLFNLFKLFYLDLPLTFEFCRNQFFSTSLHNTHV